MRHWQLSSDKDSFGPETAFLSALHTSALALESFMFLCLNLSGLMDQSSIQLKEKTMRSLQISQVFQEKCTWSHIQKKTHQKEIAAFSLTDVN